MFHTIGRFITTHGFIVATSIAMVVHSTWTFGTLFAGEQPTVYLHDLSTVLAYAFWVVPALLVALAIDVGQIQTSAKIAHAKNFSVNQIALGITFMMLAGAGFYLQWFHLAHHIPALEFGAGLTDDMTASLEGLKSMSIFIIPALLPLSTILYTLSNMTEASHDSLPASQPQPKIAVEYPAIETANNGVLPMADVADDDTQPSDPVTVAMPSNIESFGVSKSVGMTDRVTASVMANSAVTDKHCIECNKVIENPTHNQKYCNPSCRQKAYRNGKSEV